MMVSINDEKYFSRVCEISRIIFTGCKLQVFYSQIQRLKDLHLNSSVITIPKTVVRQGCVHISYHVHIENEILCHESGMSADIFSSS